MPCLEPNKNLSEQAKVILKLLARVGKATKQEIADESGLDTPLIARKLRELIGKAAVEEQNGVFVITDSGKEAAEKLT